MFQLPSRPIAVTKFNKKVFQKERVKGFLRTKFGDWNVLLERHAVVRLAVGSKSPTFLQLS